jgi:membrane-bound metal-dependent hydrolase YbcI (DUF457 family)
MLGHDHALSGALAFAAVAPMLHVSGTQLAVGTALTAGAGVLPDIDEPGSTIARTFGFLTGAFAWIVHLISGGHRKGTHSLLGIALLTAGAVAAGSWHAGAAATREHPTLWWHLVPAGLILALLFSAAFRALNIGGHHGDLFGIALAALVLWRGWDLLEVTSWQVPALAVCVALGMLAHVAGDMLTHDGCPLLYPLSRYDFGLLPEPVRITTNKLAERWVISPLLLAGLAYFVWRAAGPALTASHHLAGPLSRLRASPEAVGPLPCLSWTHRSRGAGRSTMALKILPHGRLQEWVAEDQGYFAAEDLEYTFLPEGDYGVPADGRDDAGQIKAGAFETFGAGRGGADISCACHWATNAAAGQRAGRLVSTAYSVAPCAIVVPPESPVRRAEDLAGVPVGVGYHSGSHFTTVQALEAVLAPDDVSLTFQGPPTSGSTRCWTGRCRPPRCSGSRSTLRRPSASARCSTPRS